MVVNILITIAAWFVLMLLSTNILGFLVRGLYSNPELDRLEKEGSDFIKEEVKKSKRGDSFTNIIAFLVFVAFFYALFHFWNLGVVLAALLLMISRLSDLIWEIKHGRKIDTKLLPKNALYYFDLILTIITLPILYISLFK